MKQSIKNSIRFLKSGFTTVELIVVIVILAILATIVLVAYPGYQTKINNDTRRSDMSQISAALKAYAQRNDNYIDVGSGCGSAGGAGTGTGSGWLNGSSEYWGSYQKSIVKCLQDDGFLDKNKDYIDPSGCISSSVGVGCSGSGSSGYMKKNCTLDGRKAVWLMAKLIDEPAIDSEIDDLCDTGNNWGSLYGMNYYVRVN